MRKYKCKRAQISFASTHISHLLRSAKEKDLGTHYGENDNISITVDSTLDHGTLVATLVHECLHNWCHVRGKAMGVDAAHYVMNKLGDSDNI